MSDLPATVPATGTAALSAAEIEQVASAADAALADHTRRAYSSQWSLWTQWADARGVSALPADPRHVAAYLVARASTSSPATVRLSRASIGHHHRDAGMTDPTAHAGVRKVLRGIARRQNGRRTRQAQGLTSDAMAAIRATATQRRGRETAESARTRGLLDIAICAVLRDALLRRSEAAALAWGDLETETDGSGRLRVVRAKSADSVQTAYLSPAAVRALAAIRPPDAQPSDRIFGLSAGSIARRVKSAGRAAGLGDGLSGHSGRVGMCRDLVASGASLVAVQTAGAWTSPSMPAHYARRETAGQGAVARYYAS